MKYQGHIKNCIREHTFLRLHVDGAIDELNEVYAEAETLKRMCEIFNDARKPMHIAEEEIYEILRGEQE